MSIGPAKVIWDHPHIQRMVIERDDLDAMIVKLSRYYDEYFQQLDIKQRDLMAKQLTAMRAYSDILQQRISYDIQCYSK